MGARGRVLLAAASAALACAVVASSAAAKAGDVFMSDDNSALMGALWKIGPGGGAPTSLGTGPPFDEPSGMTFDNSGDLLIIDSGAVPSIVRVDLPSGARSVYAAGAPLSNPFNIDVAPDGAVYVVDRGTPDALYRIDPVTKAFTTVAMEPAIQDPRGIAVTRDGFAYVGNFAIDGVYRVNLATGAVTTAGTGSPILTAPAEVTLTPDERTLYFSNRQLGLAHVGKLDLIGGGVTKVADLLGPNGIAILRNGDLLANSSSNDSVNRISPAGVVSGFSAGFGYGFPEDLAVEPLPCSKRFTTVAGTDAPEVLRGSPSADVIRGEGGKDVITGLGGKDVICGGDGKDVIRGGAGKDVMLGERGRDRLVGGKGRDRCTGGKGKDKPARSCERVSKIP